jgi:hypothetical protein
MAADTATVTLPETVTIPTSMAINVIALLDAYADVCGDLTAEADADAFYRVNNEATSALYPDDGEIDREVVANAIFEASYNPKKIYEESIRELIDSNDAFKIATLRRDVDMLKALVGVTDAS